MTDQWADYFDEETAPTRIQVVDLATALRALDLNDGSLLLSQAMYAVRKVIEDRGGDVVLFDTVYEADDAIVCIYPEEVKPE
jgi:hypothetical protein